jgi:lipopolysaccharide transport system ATP-binding protein
MGSITVINLGKAYKLYPNHWSRLTEWFTPFSKPRHTQVWVLKDVNFTVNSGEAVGIIGVNGAGKSTLLKMITGTAQPTTGEIHVTGRVAALLELGIGFHPEFTGRENCYMAGQLLGYTVEEITRLMPEIEAFADIGDYIDQPVRIYSSGMQVRLAFSIATAKRPEILIVDEALAVGDAAFQRKCHHRIETYINDGTSLLFVSHDIEGVKKLCVKALYLDHGNVVAMGPAKSVCDKYETMLFGGSRRIEKVSEDSGAITAKQTTPILDPSLFNSQEISYGNGDASIDRVWIENAVGQEVNILVSGEAFSVCYIVSFKRENIRPVVAMLIKTLEGIALYGTDSKSLGTPINDIKMDVKLQIRFHMRCYLSSGTYFLNCGIRDYLNSEIYLHRRVDVMMFKVINHADMGQAGLANLFANLKVETA